MPPALKALVKPTSGRAVNPNRMTIGKLARNKLINTIALIMIQWTHMRRTTAGPPKMLGSALLDRPGMTVQEPVESASTDCDTIGTAG
jgi:hypothetical protein